MTRQNGGCTGDYGMFLILYYVLSLTLKQYLKYFTVVLGHPV